MLKIFFWLGTLKFFPGLSPAAELATRTIERLTFGLLAPEVSILGNSTAGEFRFLCP